MNHKYFGNEDRLISLAEKHNHIQNYPNGTIKIENPFKDIELRGRPSRNPLAKINFKRE